jgi:xylulokinase
MAYLCFDIGSSAVKAAIISEEGSLVAIARRPVPLAHGLGGAHEADAGRWIDAALDAGAEAVSSAKRSGGKLELRALSVSGNGPTLIAVDASGKPLLPALSWLDRRATAEADEVSKLAGKVIDPTFYLPKALRLWRGADEELRERIRWFFSCPEYLLYALCGAALTYLPHPGYEPYIWNDSLLGALALPKEKFPSLCPPAKIAGELLPVIALRLGVEPGTPVVTGFPDFLAAIVGSAAVEPGLSCDRTGTSEAINLCATRPFPSRELLSLPHPVEGLWNVSGGVSTAGAALEWLASLLGFEGPARLVKEASKAPRGDGSLVFLPYLAGERAPLWDASRRGAFAGLSLEHGRPDLARAACESLAYGLKLASDRAIGEGMAFDLVRVSGHAGSEDFLCVLKADVLGVPVEVPEILDCELLGDAAAAALALGEAGSIGESAKKLSRIRRRFEPHPSRGGYERGYDSFKMALSALEGVDRASRQKV